MLKDLSNFHQKSEVAQTTLFTPSLFGGRLTRKQYWFYYILVTLASSAGCALTVYLTKHFPLTATRVLFLALFDIIFSLSMLLFFLSIMVKRCHDIGESGFMLLPFITPSVCISFFAFFIAAVGFGNLSSIDAAMPIIVISGTFSAIFGFALLLKLGFEDSEKGTNQYGPSTKYPDTVA